MAKRTPKGPASLVYVAKSAIHGRGLFAACDIPADSFILRIEGKPTQREGMHVIWYEDEEGEHGFRITNEAQFVNHSNKANAAFYELDLWSLRAIRKDEELTHNYGESWADL